MNYCEKHNYNYSDLGTCVFCDLSAERAAHEETRLALEKLRNISPETARVSSPAIAIMAQYEANQRTAYLEQRIAELEKQLHESNQSWKDLRNVLESTQKQVIELEQIIEESRNKRASGTINVHMHGFAYCTNPLGSSAELPHGSPVYASPIIQPAEKLTDELKALQAIHATLEDAFQQTDLFWMKELLATALTSMDALLVRSTKKETER